MVTLRRLPSGRLGPDGIRTEEDFRDALVQLRRRGGLGLDKLLAGIAERPPGPGYGDVGRSTLAKWINGSRLPDEGSLPGLRAVFHTWGYSQAETAEWLRVLHAVRWAGPGVDLDSPPDAEPGTPPDIPPGTDRTTREVGAAPDPDGGAARPPDLGLGTADAAPPVPPPGVPPPGVPPPGVPPPGVPPPGVPPSSAVPVPGRARPRPFTSRQLGWSLAAVAVGLAGTLLVAIARPSPVASMPVMVWWPFAIGCLVPAAFLGRWMFALVRHDPGVDADAVLTEWSRRLHGQWSTELAERVRREPSLLVTWHIDVPDEQEWADQLHEVGHPYRPRPDSLSGTGEELADLLMHELPMRRLLLIGGSGAGKSVLLRQLAAALSRPERPADAPVPVLFPLATFDPSGDVDGWLERRMILDHPPLARPCRDVDVTAARSGLQRGRVLPILDGLDEIGGVTQRAEALDKIDEWLRHQATPGLVLATRPPPVADGAEAPPHRAGETSRRDERTAAVHPPSLTVVGHVDPLTPDAARSYLGRQTDVTWDDTLLPDDADDPVTRALSRPLGISLAAAVFHRGRPGPPPARGDLVDGPGTATHTATHTDTAADGTAPREPVLRNLLAMFLPIALANPTRPSWTPEAMQRWLRTVARLTPSGTALAWWELWTHCRIPVLALLGLPGGLAVGLVALADPRLGMGVGCGVLAALAAAVVARWAWKSPEAPEDFGPGIAIGFAGGVAGALAGGVLAVELGVQESVFQGVIGALGAGVAAGGVFRRLVPSVVGGVVGGIVVAFTASTGAGLSALLVDGLAAWLAISGVIARGSGLPARALAPATSWIFVVAAAACGGTLWITTSATAGPVAGGVAAVCGTVGGYAAARGSAPVRISGFSADPAEVLAADRRTFWWLFLLAGIPAGVGAGLAVNPGVGVGAMLSIGIASAATRSAWPAFVVARGLFALSGRLPFALLPFLADAYRRDVLRRQGAAFQLRHEEMARHLLAGGQPPTTEK